MNQPEPMQRTAHQLWCDWLCGILNSPMNHFAEVALEFAPLKKHADVKKMLQRRGNELMNEAVNFETTRLRFHVDTLIEMTNKCRDALAFVQKEHAATPWWKWTKRVNLVKAGEAIKIQITAYEEATRLVINTLPPTKEQIEAMSARHMKANNE